LPTLLIDHTGELSINSSYWPIYFLPAVTAAEYSVAGYVVVARPWRRLHYCSYLYPALQEYESTRRVTGCWPSAFFSFFWRPWVVNRFVVENRRQIKRYQELAETLAETNQKLQQAQRGGATIGAAGGVGANVGWAGTRDSQSAGSDQGIGGDVASEVGGSNPLASELGAIYRVRRIVWSALVTRFLDFARPLHAELTPQNITRGWIATVHDVAVIARPRRLGAGGKTV